MLMTRLFPPCRAGEAALMDAVAGHEESLTPTASRSQKPGQDQAVGFRSQGRGEQSKSQVIIKIEEKVLLFREKTQALKPPSFDAAQVFEHGSITILAANVGAER